MHILKGDVPMTAGRWVDVCKLLAVRNIVIWLRSMWLCCSTTSLIYGGTFMLYTFVNALRGPAKRKVALFAGIAMPC